MILQCSCSVQTFAVCFYLNLTVLDEMFIKLLLYDNVKAIGFMI